MFKASQILHDVHVLACVYDVHACRNCICISMYKFFPALICILQALKPPCFIFYALFKANVCIKCKIFPYLICVFFYILFKAILP